MSLRAFLAWVWSLVILALCWLPRMYMPVREHGGPLILIPNFDKLVHMGIFAIWGFLWMGVRRSPNQALWVFLSGLGYAFLSEIVQELPIVGRDANLFDGLADMIGLGAGIGVDFLVRKYFAKKAVEPEL